MTTKTFAFYQQSNDDTFQSDGFDPYEGKSINELLEEIPMIFSLVDTEEPTDSPVLVMTLPSIYTAPFVTFTKADLTTYSQTGTYFVGPRPPRRPKID